MTPDQFEIAFLISGGDLEAMLVASESTAAPDAGMTGMLN